MPISPHYRRQMNTELKRELEKAISVIKSYAESNNLSSEVAREFLEQRDIDYDRGD